MVDKHPKREIRLRKPTTAVRFRVALSSMTTKTALRSFNLTNSLHLDKSFLPITDSVVRDDLD